jgi:ATP-binding cassette, subfamily B, bacterial
MRVPIREYLALLATYLRPQRRGLGALVILMLISIGFELLNPQIIRSFIDTAAAGGEVERLTQAALLFVAVAIAQQATAVGATYMGERIGWISTNALRGDLTDHAVRLDMSFHKARTPGEIIERIDGDVTALSRFFSQFVVQLLGNALLLLGVLALLAREDWRVGLGLALFVLVAVVVLSWLQRIAVPRWTAVRQVSAEFYGFLGETLSATEDVRGNGAVGYVLRRFQALIQRWFPLQLTANLAGYSMWMSSLAIFALGTATAFGISAWLYMEGALSIGAVYLIFHYTELLRRPIEQIRVELQHLQQAGASIVRVRELLAVRPQIIGGVGQLPDGALEVCFRQVSFTYQDAPISIAPLPRADEESDQGGAADMSPEPAANEPVLRALNLQLSPGSVLGLLGRTGSGKTSMARLLVRLYDVTDGAIELGGVDLRDVRLANLRTRVGLVTQDVQLFEGSLRENLTLFDDSIGDAQLTQVLETIGLGEWLRSLPEGLATHLAGTGGLSAGEAQLLALTRVFLRDPGLVILDEASSRLDPATEALLERAIDRLLAGRTAIIIAHRLRTVQRADQILILENGEVAEFGARADLLANPDSRFSRVLRAGLEEVLV